MLNIKIKKNTQILLLANLLVYLSNIGKAQYIEKDELKHFAGIWIGKVNETDSVLLEMKLKKNFQFKTDSHDIGVSSDVLKMKFKYFKSGKIVLNSDEYDTNNLSNVAMLGNYDDLNDVILSFAYFESNEDNDIHLGRGTLHVKDRIMNMVLDTTREKIIVGDPNKNNQQPKSSRSKMIMPKKLTFTKKSE